MAKLAVKKICHTSSLTREYPLFRDFKDRLQKLFSSKTITSTRSTGTLKVCWHTQLLGHGHVVLIEIASGAKKLMKH